MTQPKTLLERIREDLNSYENLGLDADIAEFIHTLKLAQAEITSLMTQVDCYREALTVNLGTKAEYINEFSFRVLFFTEDDLETGDELELEVTVPWDTTKDVMKMILARAEREIARMVGEQK